MTSRSGFGSKAVQIVRSHSFCMWAVLFCAGRVPALILAMERGHHLHVYARTFSCRA